jgi:hypothetical protein
VEQSQIDLIYMPKSWFSNGFKDIFACVDVFSKKADMIPLKDRKQTTATKAFEKLLDNIISDPVCTYPARILSNTN